MGKKSHSSHKEVTEREDKHRPKSKAEKKLEQHEHKLKVKRVYFYIDMITSEHIIIETGQD